MEKNGETDLKNLTMTILLLLVYTTRSAMPACLVCGTPTLMRCCQECYDRAKTADKSPVMDSLMNLEASYKKLRFAGSGGSVELLQEVLVRMDGMRLRILGHDLFGQIFGPGKLDAVTSQRE